MEEKFIMVKCECGSEVIEVQHWPEEQQFYFAFWQQGFMRPLCWRERLRWCWRILRTGNPWGDSIIASEQKTKQIADFLNEHLDGKKEENSRE